MKKILWMAIVGLIFFAASCKKEVAKSGEPDTPVVAPDNSGEVINDSIFHFTALADGVEISLQNQNGAPNVCLQYALYTDGSCFEWKPFPAGRTITLPNAGDKLYIKTAIERNEAYASSLNKRNTFSISDTASVGGNIMYLLRPDGTTPGGFALTTHKYAFTFACLFQNCTKLTSADSLILPADELPASCYRRMFYNCRSLKTGPALPATTLAEWCYEGMFLNCGSLTTAPALPATTMAAQCYYAMFSNCVSLTTAPVLPADALAASCYTNMFQQCSNLQSVTMLATKRTNASSCLGGWLVSAGKNVAGTKYVYVAAEEGSTAYNDIQNSLPDRGTGDWQLAPYVPEEE